MLFAQQHSFSLTKPEGRLPLGDGMEIQISAYDSITPMVLLASMGQTNGKKPQKFCLCNSHAGKGPISLFHVPSSLLYWSGACLMLLALSRLPFPQKNMLLICSRYPSVMMLANGSIAVVRSLCPTSYSSAEEHRWKPSTLHQCYTNSGDYRLVV
jgi:hypothetical protein